MENIEDTDYVASEHDRLVSAITKLDKTQHITEPTRNEPTNLNSEFNLIKRTNKLNLTNISKVLENTSHHVQISKKLKKTQDESKVLSRPLEKPQAERIRRATGYEETKKRVGRWDPVVARSRTVDHVTFPLNHVSTKLQPTGEFLSKFKLKSDLEKELDELNPPVVEESDEEQQIFPVSYEEMLDHRQNLAKIRAQQSYKAAKAKRQGKIKSKKYHRVLKKEKLKQQLKEFEELQKVDPEEALKKLEALEKDRALERHTLRHKNTGKWAKNKLIRAKYDKEVRQQLAEQLAVSRSLTQKIGNNQSSDDEEENEVIPDINLVQDPLNSWMFQRSDKSNVNAEFDFGYKKYVQNKTKQNIDSDSDASDDNLELKSKNELNVSKASLNKLTRNDVEGSAHTYIDKIKSTEKSIICKNVNLSEAEPITVKRNKKNNLITQTKTSKDLKKPSKTNIPVATSDWVVETVNDVQTNTVDQISSAFENHELSVEKQVEKKLKEIRWNIERLEKASQRENVKLKEKTKEIDNLERLSFKPKNVKAVIDEELIETSKNVETIENDTETTPITSILNGAPLPAEQSTNSNIDTTGFIGVKPKYLTTALSQVANEYDQLDDDEQVVPKVNIEEVFEEDDAVDSFRQEKEEEMNKDKPLENPSLPGWGAWVGKGVKPQKRKKNRFIVKAPPKMPRRDENKGDVIIREYKDPKLAAHKVKDVPFPFESVKDYEASIRAPLGNTFIPEKAHKKLIQPSVITKSGTVIEPMTEEELLVPRNRNFKNEAVLKILGQKKIKNK